MTPKIPDYLTNCDIPTIISIYIDIICGRYKVCKKIGHQLTLIA